MENSFMQLSTAAPNLDRQPRVVQGKGELVLVVDDTDDAF
jgi:hypothetical protein